MKHQELILFPSKQRKSELRSLCQVTSCCWLHHHPSIITLFLRKVLLSNFIPRFLYLWRRMSLHDSLCQNLSHWSCFVVEFLSISMKNEAKRKEILSLSLDKVSLSSSLLTNFLSLSLYWQTSLFDSLWKRLSWLFLIFDDQFLKLQTKQTSLHQIRNDLKQQNFRLCSQYYYEFISIQLHSLCLLGQNRSEFIIIFVIISRTLTSHARQWETLNIRRETNTEKMIEYDDKGKNPDENKERN